MIAPLVDQNDPMLPAVIAMERAVQKKCERDE
jgi:hypothetical protein